MFNKFIKKYSKLFAVVLTATLAFSPLSYATTTPTGFADFLTIVQSDGTVTSVSVDVDGDITADTTEQDLGPVTVNAAVTDLTIKSDVDGTNRTIDAKAGNNNAGFKMAEGQTAIIKDITLQNFYKADDTGAVIDNEHGDITITNSSFNNNQVTGTLGDSGFGGVINHDSTDNGSGERIGSLTIVGSTFTVNTATVAGAIMSTGVLDITDTKFANNTGTEVAGALGIFGSKDDTTSINNIEFNANTAVQGGGAIALGSEANVQIQNGSFINNTATGATGNGGAIATQNFVGGASDFSEARLGITDSSFSGNTAVNGKGGAIDNYFYKSKTGETENEYVYVSGTDFSANSATDGGAIYNHGEKDESSEEKTASMLVENANFTNNIASNKGGAIYNGGKLVVNNSVFTGNKANSVDNDIYNDGDLSFLSGTTTMQGGIIGNGTTTVKGATLTLGNTASLEQWGLNVEEDSSLELNYGNLTIKNAEKQIKNDGLITFNLADAGTVDLDYSFTGDTDKGKIVFNNTSGGDVTVNANDIAQSTVTVNGFNLSVGSTKQIDANSLTGSGNIDNKGIINLDLLANDGYALTGDLTGDGITNIDTQNVASEDTNVILNLAGKAISQVFNLSGDKSFFVHGALAGGSAMIVNNYLSGSSLEIDESFDRTIEVNNYPASSTTQGVVNVMYKGQVDTLTNSGGVVNVVNIDSTKTDNTDFEINDLNTIDATYRTDDKILKNNLNIGTTSEDSKGGRAKINSGKTISYQNVKISSGSLDASAGTIDNSVVTIEENGKLIANASNITNLRNASDGTTTDAKISNAGELNFTAGTNINDITGTGILSIAGTVANTLGKKIVQNAINIISGTFTASASDIDAASNSGTGIANEASLVFEDTTPSSTMVNISTITTATTNGTLTILSDLNNTADIDQKSVTIGDGSTKNAAVTNSAVIKSTDVVINAGSSLRTSNEIDTYDDGNITGGKITNNGEFTIAVPSAVGNVRNDNTIDGTGTFKLEDTIFENRNGSIEQTNVEVDGTSALTSAANKINVTNGIKSAGTVTFTGGASDAYVTNISSVTGLGTTPVYGETIFDAGSFITNSATIHQNKVTVLGTVDNGEAITVENSLIINGDGSLKTSASNIIGDIVNNKNLEFTGGTISSVITGTGTVKMTGNIINDVDLNQSTVTVNSGVILTNNVGKKITTNYVSGEGTLTNNGDLILDLLDNKGFDIAVLNGVGTSSITATTSGITMDLAGKTLEQDVIKFYGDSKTLNLSNGTATATTKIQNYITGDSLHIVNTVLDTPLFINEADGHTVFENGSEVNGVIQNDAGTIDILSNGFTTKDDITSTVTTDITNNKFNIGNASNAAVFTSSHTISYQTITVSSGTMTMKDTTDGTIDNSSISVTSDGKLVVNASKITNLQGTSIANAGVVEFYDGTNSNAITGTGTLDITGTVVNTEGVAISQKDIKVESGKSFTASANDLTTTDGIANEGTLTFTATSDMTNAATNAITGKGTLNVETTLNNNANITQKNININGGTFANNTDVTAEYDTGAGNGGVFTVAAPATVVNTASDKNINAYTFNNSGTVVSSGTIAVTETFTNSGDVDNKAEGAITAKNLTNTSVGTIVSTGTITVTQTITNSGTIANEGAITATTVTNNDEIINVGNGTITAASGVTNYGTLTTDSASNIVATVYNSGDGTTTGVYNVKGGTITYNVNGISSDKARVNILGAVAVSSAAIIAQNTVNLGNGTDEAALKLDDETSVRASSLIINNNSTLNTINGKIGEINSDGSVEITAGALWNYDLDVDLKAGKGDSLVNVTAGAGSVATISELGILSDKAQLTSIKIADANIINAASVVQSPVYTSELTYKVTARGIDSGEDKGTYLDIIADGYGGLPNAMYDGVTNYSLTVATDEVNAWIEDPVGVVQHNFLKNNLTITGNQHDLISNPTGIDGIIVSSGTIDGTTLKIKDLNSMQGFNNAIIADEDGSLYIMDQTNTLIFSGNTGDAVVTSSGTAWMDNVKFSSNTVNDAAVKNGGEMRLSRVEFGTGSEANSAPIDVLNEGSLYIGDASGAHQPSVFAKGIAGKGDLKIDGVNLDMTNVYVSQEEISLTDNDYSGLTTKVENLTYGTDTTKRIYNDSDNLKLIGDASGIDLNTSIKGLGSTVLASTMTVKKDIEQNALTIGDGTGTKVIVDNGRNVYAKNITVADGAVLNTNADNVNTASNGKITNSGLVEFTGGTNKNVFDGTGSLKISGNVKNSTGTAVTQKDITVNSGSFEANASDLTTTAGIVNNADLTFTGGTNIAANAITGTGDLTIIDSLLNKADITQNSITINAGITENEGSILTTGTTGLTIASGATLITHEGIDTYTNGGSIANDGTFEVSVGGAAENQNDITGTGIFKLTAGEFDNVNGTITQGSVVLSTAAVFKSSATLVTTTAGIVNDGAMTYYDGTNNNVITGTGDLTIDGDVNTTNVSITQNTITVNNSKSLTADADDLITINGIANEGLITFVNDGTNNNAISGTNGNLLINGSVINSTGTAVSQKNITVVGGKSFEANADDIKTTDEITNYGTMTFYGGTNSNLINGSASGVLNVVGSLVNNRNINQDTINIKNGMTINNADVSASTLMDIAAGAGITTNANNIVLTPNITNAGDIVFTGGTNNSAISGAGNLTVTGAVINNNTVAQTEVDITEAGSFTTAANAVSATVVNDGILEWNGGAGDSNNNWVKGIGLLKLTGGTDVTNTAVVSQGSMDVQSGSRFITNAGNLTVTNPISNAGVIEYNGGTNNNAITGTGSMNISGTVINALGTTVNQSSVTVNSGANWTAYASDITTTGVGIVNDGTVNYTGGVNISTITRTGTNGILNVTGDLYNTAAITQETINVTSEYFNNAENSLITATTLNADTVLYGYAKDLSVGTIAMSNNAILTLQDTAAATLASNITGSGALVKQGAGTVTLSGTNTYSDPTIISGGALQISAKTNISDGNGKLIYFDGGKLITTADMQLDSDLIGTTSQDGTINDVVVDVNVGITTMTANSNIYGNKNLVKQGAGTLDLQMTENYYAGDTEIQNGKIRGTTANILGKVIGTGTAASEAEFYDASGDVELNEIDTTNYLGKFEKTGAATMTVDKNFKAIDADITAGTFVINNDASMGGSGSTFEVTNNMKVTNALLKGYGDITVGTLTIGDGATYAPGNSTTTFKVAGNLHYENNSTYDVEIGQFSPDAAGTYNDKTTVTGTTTIDAGGKLVLNNLEGKYYQHETIDLIESAGSLTNNGYVTTGSDTYTDEGDHHKVVDGTITFKDFDAADLRDGYDTRISTSVYVEGNVLKINLERKASEYEIAKEFRRSHNEQQAAEAIDRLSALSNEGDITTVLDKMEEYYYYNTTYDLDSLRVALNDIAGVIHANSTNLSFFNAKAEHVYDKVRERTSDLYPCNKFHDKLWGEYYYNYNSVNENSNSPKYTSSVNGFLVGFDMMSASNWTIGAMAGYGTSELKQRDDKTTMDDINLGFYGGYIGENWDFKGMLLGGYEQYKTDRTIHFLDERRVANSEHTGYSGALDLEVAYKIALNGQSKTNHKLFLKPFFGLLGSYMNNGGYKEKGAQSLNLKIEGYDNFAAEARAGVGISGKAKKLNWYAKAGIRRLLTDEANEIETSLLDYSATTKMKIKSAEVAGTAFTGGLGADYKLSEDWTVFANALSNLSGASDNYYANVGLSYKFGCVNNKPRKETVEEVEIEEIEKEKADTRVIKSIVLEEKPTFIFDTDQLNDEGKEKLKQVAADLEKHPEATVIIEGHADNLGSDNVNKKISEMRANAIAKTLKKEYKVKNDIAVVGKSKTHPIASNDTKEGRAQNRRVEIVILGADK